MPLLQLNLSDVSISELQRGQLVAGLTQRMSSLMGKRADLTVVHISESEPKDWSVDGSCMDAGGWCASLLVYVTSGTNTANEQSTFIASAHSLLCEVLGGPPKAPVYVVVTEVAAHSWGTVGGHS
jgi:phenylpyruvate tautomerase PptA (4-oxalocrotonate tautomerase family)